MTQLETPTQTPKQSRLQKKHLEARKRLEESRKKQKVETPAFKSPEFVDDSDESEEPPESDVEHGMEAEVVQNEPETEVEEPTWTKNASFLRPYLLRRNDNRTQTHGSFVGGRYHIPSEKIEEFHRRYLQEFRASTSPSLFLLERYSTEPFRFFVDIDYNFSDENVPAHTEVIARLRRALVGRWDSWRPDSSGYKPTMDLFPCRAACRTRWKLHTLFYNVIVDWQSAIRMGQLLQNSLDGSDEQRVVIDMKVYHKGSLRMIGSYKKFDTTPSHTNETDFVYTPMDINTGELLEWTDQTLEEYSIFPSQIQREFIDRANSEGSFLAEDDSLIFTTPEGGVGRDSEPVQYTGSGMVSQGSALYMCIKDHFGEAVASAAERIIHNSETNCSTVDCSKTTYCPLAKRNHNGNHPYIVLSEFGMRLKCHSTTDEVCRKGGQLIPRKTLPEEVLSELPAVSESDEADEANAVARAALDGTNAALAEFYFDRIKGKYMATQEKDQQNLVWYAFRQPIWHTNIAYSWLMIDIKSSVPLFEEFARELEAAEEEDEGEGKKSQKPSALALSTVKKLKTNSFKKDICKELSHMVSTSLDTSISDLPFSDRLNVYRNKHLIAFKNGVYDLNEHVFREGRPDDYFSFSTGYNYAEEADSPKIADLRRYYEQIQPDPDIREYLLKTMSTTLDGEVKEQKIYVWYGAKGEGSKSTNADMLVATLGDFARKISSSYLVQEQPSSENATNTMVLCRGRRLAIAEEFKPGATLNDATCKQFTGTVNVIRDNFSKQKNVDNTTTLFTQTNCELRSQSGDHAINRRIEHIPFLSRFVDNPDPADPRQFKKDKDFTSKFVSDDALKLANFHILLGYYKLYQRDGLTPPPAVVELRERFEAMSNPVGVWLKVGVIRKTGTNAGLAEMKRCYSAWYYKSFNMEPNTKNFQDSLQQNSIMVEILRNKSCTSWVDQYDQTTRKSIRVKKKISTQPAALDIELVDVEAGEEAEVAEPVI